MRQEAGPGSSALVCLLLVVDQSGVARRMMFVFWAWLRVVVREVTDQDGFSYAQESTRREREAGVVVSGMAWMVDETWMP